MLKHQIFAKTFNLALILKKSLDLGLDGLGRVELFPVKKIYRIWSGFGQRNEKKYTEKQDNLPC